MAVIISDMEKVPCSCFDCELHNYHFCNLTGNLVENNLDDGTRAGDCPLKEVSDNSVLEDIKAKLDHDLKEAPYMYDDEHLDELYGFQDGLEHALHIMDKHIDGKER